MIAYCFEAYKQPVLYHVPRKKPLVESRFTAETDGQN